MMCRSLSWYSKASWTKSTSPVEAPTALTSDDRLEIDRFSSPTFNHIYFPLRVSPVAFEDGGLFRCNFNSHLMSYVQLTTIQVSASGGPPGGQSVVLKCEVSEVSGDPVTLAWLRMEGRRGLLVKQDVLTESHPNRTLSVTLPSLQRLHSADFDHCDLYCSGCCWDPDWFSGVLPEEEEDRPRDQVIPELIYVNTPHFNTYENSH
ncbi:uncharacterized protein LOC121554920 [Coregonus clupeaformis]|uniref:uncharacterized protein LOC121554920 n=1 Tax=Coregonus clupeaformis TaxID=59861 RepID=UPI001E1C8321|nr:uncharacterized protein LOC121554920 [Coregonus clupeaformis]